MYTLIGLLILVAGIFSCEREEPVVPGLYAITNVNEVPMNREMIVYDKPDQFGTVEVDRRADLVLLESNPLLDISNLREVAVVMVRGEWLSDNDIQQRLDEIAAWAQDQ